jgi:ribulose-5-phosphate 4-epimerase/fuculose-1-phosphate aldolase
MDKQYQQLIELGKYLVKYGYASGSAGNISVRLGDGNILVSPTNSHLGTLESEELSLLSMDGQHLAGKKPSKELSTQIHAQYRYFFSSKISKPVYVL